MGTRMKKLFWDAVFLIAIIGIGYGAWGIIEAKGWGIGLPVVVLTVILGVLSMEILGPMWFRKW